VFFSNNKSANNTFYGRLCYTSLFLFLFLIKKQRDASEMAKWKTLNGPVIVIDNISSRLGTAAGPPKIAGHDNTIYTLNHSKMIEIKSNNRNF
jgi:hypothetical protein